MKEEKSDIDREFDERWERAKKVKVKRSPDQGKTSVFSIKMDRELLRLLVERARELGVGTSTLARTLIAEGLVTEEHLLTDEALIALLRHRLSKAKMESTGSSNAHYIIKATKQAIIGSPTRNTIEPEGRGHEEGSTSYLSLTGS